MQIDTLAMRLPILYSFRRCPYAMRARMALSYAGIALELREVVLRNKPVELLQTSAKGTVPVLVDTGGAVIDESLDIMLWALDQSDPENWLRDWRDGSLTQALIRENDSMFKATLDHYKYADRYPEQPAAAYRAEGERFLLKLEQQLHNHACLIANDFTLADAALLPFIRQFAHVDKAWFDRADYPALQRWLATCLEADLFTGIMPKYPQWQVGQAPVVVNLQNV